MASQDRQYELILFGATGYTGRLTAEHITTHLPSDLKWAVAGRSADKLEALIKDIKPLNADRAQPSIEIAQLNERELDVLAKKTKLLISVVGPYCLYGEPVVAACAKNGTHYLDVTGETPWVYDIVQKYHDVAKSTGAIIIPQIGIESAPADLLTWSLVTLIQEKLSTTTREVVVSIHNMSGAPSGGTSATILAILQKYSLAQVTRAFKPYALSPVAGPRVADPAGVLGVRTIPGLGILTTAPTSTTDRSLVHRSWGLMGGGSYYGPNFSFRGYLRVRSYLFGVLVRVGLAVGMVALALPPVRWLLKLFMYAPGTGASKEETAKESIEYRALATADHPSSSSAPPHHARASFAYNGGLYYLTGIFLAEAAVVILRGKTEGKGRIMARALGGGVLTPATLGESYIERLRTAGVKFETELID